MAMASLQALLTWAWQEPGVKGVLGVLGVPGSAAAPAAGVWGVEVKWSGCCRALLLECQAGLTPVRC